MQEEKLKIYLLLFWKEIMLSLEFWLMTW